MAGECLSLDAIASLLARCDLPSDDLSGSDLAHFDAVIEAGRLVGVVSLQAVDGVAWLRSLAVDPAVRGQGLGHLLLERAERRAARSQAHSISLLTTTAEPFFAAAGYETFGRDTASPAVRAFRQFNASGCSSGVFMTKRLVARGIQP